jgi:hypothetical protein
MNSIHAPLLPLSRMARRLGVTAGWLRSEADNGRVPCLVAGRRYLFAPGAVEQILAQRAAIGPALDVGGHDAGQRVVPVAQANSNCSDLHPLTK